MSTDSANPTPAAPARKRVFISAGELSGDLHAARLIRGIPAEARAQIDFHGIGGDSMAGEGVRLLANASELAVVGVWEVVKRLPAIWRIYRRACRALRENPPDALLLVDYPGFNLKLAAYAHKLGIPVAYYISPQVWAWNRARIPRMARIIDLLMVIFPFEVDVFKDTSLHPVFVGHPLVPSIQATLAKPPEPVPWPSQDDTTQTAPADRVAILPGSRRMEIERILPLLLAAAQEIHRRRPAVRFVVTAAGPEQEALIRPQLEALPADVRSLFALNTGHMRSVVRTARAAMVCSGTATVETGLLSCPMIVVYRAAPLTYWLGRKVVRVKWLGMVNLVADRTLCPEFIQGDATPTAMADAVLPLLDDTPARRAQLDGLAAVSRALAGDPSTTPALALLHFLSQSSPLES